MIALIGGQIATSVRPWQVPDPEVGEYPHGWQYFASQIIERSDHESTLAAMSLSDRAIMRSQSGQGPGPICSPFLHVKN